MLDIFLLIVIAWAVFSGWRNGALREIVSSLGFLVGLFIAATAYDTLGAYLAVDGSKGNVITSVIAFLILWIVVPIALGAAATMLTKALEKIYLGWLNSLVGAFVSLVKYVFLLGCILYVLSGLGILNEQRTKESFLCAVIDANFSAFWQGLQDAQEPQNASHDAGSENDTIWIERKTTK